MDIIYIIISLLLVFGLMPFVGKKIYRLESKKFFSIYLICVIVLFGINILFSNLPNFSITLGIFTFLGNIITKSDFNTYFYLYSIYICLVSGLGIFGAPAEAVGEVIEESGIYAATKNREPIKNIFMYMVYGYLFILAIYSINRVLFLMLGLSYKPEFLPLQYVFETLFFNSPYIYIIGLILFGIKAFRYGYSSKEYWKTNLTYKETENNWYRFLRKFIAIGTVIWGLYVILLFVSFPTYGITNPFGNYSLEFLSIIFHLFIFIESLFFYTNLPQLVHSLKVEDEDFAKKVDTSIKIKDIDKDEIKFD